jgi:SEC-C motif-containing protein/exostosin family protein
MLFVKSNRILKNEYPDEALLERLNNISFAEHNIPEHEFLQFRRLQSLIYSLRVTGYDIEAMQTEVFIGAALFCYVNCKVLVTRCEYDFEINDEVIHKLRGGLPSDLIWLTTNANLVHNKIQAFPIGITDYCGYTPYHQIIGDTELFKSHVETQQRTQKNLVLMNFNDRTNLRVRSPVRSFFSNKKFVTDDTYSADATGYTKYIQGLRSHPFCLAPRGNGIDTHRIWECLYAGCIPIVQKHLALRDFSDLPILFIEHWEDINESFLNGTLKEFNQKKWDLRRLTLSYWYKYIRGLLDLEIPISFTQIKRNQLCPCGSGKKYKHCHGAFA